MRNLLFLAGCLFITGIFSSRASAQSDSIPAYMRIGTIPEFTNYKAPDSSVFTKKNVRKGRPVLLMIFSPDCGHCQNVTTEITKNIEHFGKAQILMVTWLPYSEMISFYKNYKIADYPQIDLSWDPKYFFLPYYHVQSYPKLVVYNKKGKYVKEFQGNIKIDDVWKAMGEK